MRFEQRVYKQAVYLLIIVMRNIFYTLLLLFTLLSCKESNYTITGTVKDAKNGERVSLGYSVYGEDFTKTDETTIKNGNFHFSGEIEGCKIYYLLYSSEDYEISTPFFLESGDITASLSNNVSRVSGTPTNDRNLEFEDSIAWYVNEIFSIQNRLYSDSIMPDTERSTLALSGYELQNKSMMYVKKVIKENITSILGLYLLVQFADIFDIQELEELERKIPTVHQARSNNSLYDILIEIIDERK